MQRSTGFLVGTEIYWVSCEWQRLTGFPLSAEINWVNWVSCHFQCDASSYDP